MVNSPQAPKPWQWLMAVALSGIFFVGSLAIGSHQNAFSFRNFSDRHSESEARISSTRCFDHGRLLYEFSVDGKTFSGSTYGADRPCDHVRIGERLTVFYDPANPTVNTTDSPGLVFRHQVSGLFTDVLFWVVVTCIFFFPLVRDQVRSGMPIRLWMRSDEG